MLLTKAHVTNFKSIEDSSPVDISENTTVLVGRNESGKSAFLQALYRTEPSEDDVEFDHVQEYPRRYLNDYSEIHDSDPGIAVILTFQLNDPEISRINDFFGVKLLTELTFTQTYRYNNRTTVGINFPESAYVSHRLSQAKLASEAQTKAQRASTIAELITVLEETDLNSEDEAFLQELQTTFAANKNWSNPFQAKLYKTFVEPYVPTFVYFDDYYLLPGKVNLADLQTRLANPETLRKEDKTAHSLMRLARVNADDLANPDGYEQIKAKLEGISISITDKVFKYWKQNEDLEVEFDIREDPKADAPFNNGANLYIRIRNKRHRVTVPFDQRSKGFIWFFSFIAWFDSIKREVTNASDLILLLDEPGLSLHALAQSDFLSYIDELSKSHQILYTTHSPFMVQSDRLHDVRTVIDHISSGTKISSNVSDSDAHTIFPLQAALGYTIAQNLFISSRNLLVEGASDLVYLQYFSNVLDERGRTGLRDDVVIVPVGGLDKLATFVALLRGQRLDLVIVHDSSSKPDAKLESLAQQKIIEKKNIMNFGMFRTTGGTSSASTDIEDLISPSIYLQLFNAAFSSELSSKTLKVRDLPSGDRIIERINQYLRAHAMNLRPSGGFNHYRVSNYLAAHPLAPSKLDSSTLDRFEDMFANINSAFT